MNRDQKAAAIAEIAGEITESQAILAVDPTGLSVEQAAEIRTKLRDADARLRVTKNTLTIRAADEAGVESLKELLVGPTALTFVRGDAAAAAKAISDYAKATDKLPFKGGYMDGAALTVDEIANEITEASAVFAVDPTGLSVSQSVEIRTALRAADARLRIVKNTLTLRAADKAGVEELKALLEGPTALTFVRGDAAAAAKAISDYSRQTDLLPFKGGLMDGAPLEIEQIKAIARLPSRDVLYGQLVGMIASPITGLARGLNALLSGVAIALGQVQAKAEAGEIQLGGGAGEAPPAEEPAAEEPAAEAEAAPAEEPATEEPAAEAEEPAADQDAEAPEQPAAAEEPAEGAEDAAESTDPQTDDNEE